MNMFDEFEAELLKQLLLQMFIQALQFSLHLTVIKVLKMTG